MNEQNTLSQHRTREKFPKPRFHCTHCFLCPRCVCVCVCEPKSHLSNYCSFNTSEYVVVALYRVAAVDHWLLFIVKPSIHWAHCSAIHIMRPFVRFSFAFGEKHSNRARSLSFSLAFAAAFAGIEFHASFAVRIQSIFRRTLAAHFLRWRCIALVRRKDYGVTDSHRFTAEAYSVRKLTTKTEGRK